MPHPHPSTSPARGALVTMAAVIAIGAGLAGCFEVRASVGPRVGGGGRRSLDATAGYGIGWSYAGHQAIYLGGKAGVSVDDATHFMSVSSLDYAAFDAPWPYRIGLRLGVITDGKDASHHALTDAYLGGGAAWFPFHRHASGNHADHEKGFELGPPIASWANLGFELDIDALFPARPGDTITPTVSLALVLEYDSLVDK